VRLEVVERDDRPSATRRRGRRRAKRERRRRRKRGRGSVGVGSRTRRRGIRRVVDDIHLGPLRIRAHERGGTGVPLRVAARPAPCGGRGDGIVLVGDARGGSAVWWHELDLEVEWVVGFGWRRADEYECLFMEGGGKTKVVSQNGDNGDNGRRSKNWRRGEAGFICIPFRVSRTTMWRRSSTSVDPIDSVVANSCWHGGPFLSALLVEIDEH